MARKILSVILGYVVMFVFIFVLFTVLYLLLGSNGSFKPGLYQPSLLWLALSTPLAFVAAVGGGYVCAALARGGRAPLALAALVLVLGILSAVPVFMSPQTDAVRTSDVTNTEAMMKAKEPAGVALTNPLLGAAGVLVGAWFRRRRATI
jgi:small-conductance mechanosensitive channel